MMRGMRVPPPCWMFQARASFHLDLCATPIEMNDQLPTVAMVIP
jgi:hypothetical protein